MNSRWCSPIVVRSGQRNQHTFILAMVVISRDRSTFRSGMSESRARSSMALIRPRCSRPTFLRFFHVTVYFQVTANFHSKMRNKSFPLTSLHVSTYFFILQKKLSFLPPQINISTYFVADHWFNRNVACKLFDDRMVRRAGDLPSQSNRQSEAEC